MTPVHLYCLLPAPSALTLPATPSIRVLDFGSVTAWVSDTGEPTLSRDARDVARATIEHDQVIGAALAQGITPVPASLGDPYENDAAARADIEAHTPAITAALARVKDRVEMTTIIAIADAAPPADAAGRGHAYLEQLRSQPTRASEIADRVSGALQDLAGPARRRSEKGRVALSHLISRTAVGEYRTRALGAAGEGYRIVIDGPRAPYSFVRFSARHGILADAPASTA